MRKAVFMIAMIFAASWTLAAQQSTSPKPATKAVGASSSSKTTEAKINEAMKAAPPDIAKGAMIMDWPDTPNGPMKDLRKGTNSWTCMPSTPANFGNIALTDPMCLDKQFMSWAGAWMSKKDPQVTGVGVAYMLRGDKGASNTDPFATGPTSTNQWIVSPAHIMVVVPNAAQLEGIPTDPHNGGPWVMWKGTKYQHIMVPVAPAVKPTAAAKP